ncbi:hypothetical protein FE810_02130 [Thalassotalea litorea]|uniref:Uncharacterized protein n=1 Tax=Thalassotalea litorea TaxID=2020715 RepID=A0A5R9IVA9_9GAMM|nr:NAD(P)-binding domain-containing protein [Thalassotalea litorea]TLU67106.1 hypothetical protein FE810_02130 [Thalassotalea litorea]
MKNKSITIIGAGWLGLPLAQHLKANGADVLVTATSDENVKVLAGKGLTAVCYQVKPENNCANDPVDGLMNAQSRKSRVFASDVVVVCIPPRIRHGQTDYPNIIAQLVKDASSVKSQVKQFILCSSTAVYNGLAAAVDETSELNLTTEKTKILAQAEQQVLRSSIPLSQVIRLGGLIGPNRHPGKFFRAGRVIPNPDSVINFIHQADVIGIIGFMIENCATLTADIINAVAPAHPSRREFYQAAHRVVNGDCPEFSEQVEQQGKRVEPNVLLRQNYPFQYRDVMAWLQPGNEQG